ncbi:hypothetical protein HQ590_13610, partial [bacterium]|nr:hypothetical protein [bacterium]
MTSPQADGGSEPILVIRVIHGCFRRLRLVSPALAGLAIVLALYHTWGTQQILVGAMENSAGGGRLVKDALGYYEIATTPDPFYRASVREPLFPALLRFGLQTSGHLQPADDSAVGRSHVFVRRFTGWFGLATLLGVSLLAWRLAGPWAGAGAAWMYGLGALIAQYAVSGLRESTTGLFHVCLIGALVTEPRSRLGAAIRTVVVVLLSAALPLLRLESLAVVPLLLLGTVIWRWLRAAGPHRAWRRPAFEAVAGIVAGWIAVAPFLLACRQQFGEAFYVTSVHATYWRNQEFAGQPGHLSRDEVMADPYAGPRVTPRVYIFGMHSLPAVVTRYARGYWITLTRDVPILFRRLAPGANPTDTAANPLVWLWVLGLVWSVVRWRTQAFVPWAALAAQLPYAFIVPLDTVLA